MAYKFNYITLVLSLCMLLTACKEDVLSVVEPVITDTDKTPIEFTVGGVDGTSLTRAVITDGMGKTLNGFTTKTRLFFYFKSEDSQTEPSHTHTATKYALTYATASKPGTGAEKSSIETKLEQQLFWDDAHARDSKLTVYACGTANHEQSTMTIDSKEYGKKTGVQDKYEFQFDVIQPTVVWTVGGNDNFNYSDYQHGDFIFSNNIADYHDFDGKSDDRMVFHFEDGEKYRKFDKGDLIFYHALTKVTFHVVMGEGFSESEFKLTSENNIALKGFNTQGKFNLSTGEFESSTIENTKVFNRIAPTTAPAGDKSIELHSREVNNNTQRYYELAAYLVPGTDIKSSAVSDALTLVINNITYKVSMKTLYEKLLANTANQKNASTVKESVLTHGTNLKAGVNYLFTLTVSKSRIDQITASVTDWKTITTSEQTPSNAKVSLMLEERGDVFEDNTEITVYRASETSAASNWTTGYVGNYNTLKKTSGTWALTGDNWFWPDNKTFYHFRAIMPKDVAVVKDETSDPDVDYVSLTSDQVGTYKDVCWGAPMRDDGDNETVGSFKWMYYFDKGFGVTNTALSNQNQIYEAIGATNATLKFTLFHMMSEINVKLTTTEGADKVLLSKTTDPATTTYSTVELIDYKNGRLLLGTGKIEAVGDKKTTGINRKTEDNVFEYPFGVVPQDLSSVKLRVKTPNDNVYLVDLKDAIANADTNDGGETENLTSTNIVNPYAETSEGSNKYIIDKWYPGFKYEYTINLTLKGIDQVGVKLVDWTKVEMDETGIQIK